MIESLATQLMNFLTGMVAEQRRFAHGARILAEKHDGWRVVAEHCDRRAAAAQRMLDEWPILMAWHGFESLVEPVSQQMIDAWTGGYGPPGDHDARELHSLACAMMEEKGKR